MSIIFAFFDGNKGPQTNPMLIEEGTAKFETRSMSAKAKVVRDGKQRFLVTATSAEAEKSGAHYSI